MMGDHEAPRAELFHGPLIERATYAATEHIRAISQQVKKFCLDPTSHCWNVLFV